MSLINTQVQPFKVNAFHNGKFIEVTEQSLKGKWSVLIFMPAAFTFNCPTEIEDAANNYAEFQKAGTEVYTAGIADACARAGVEILVLDRPNPNGFFTDGPMMKNEFNSPRSHFHRLASR